jgi:hypothetical protein
MDRRAAGRVIGRIAILALATIAIGAAGGSLPVPAAGFAQPPAGSGGLVSGLRRVPLVVLPAPSVLDRFAYAIDGVESSHGANPAMWRPDFAGPQGPMQVTRAAALDVGGGDRFDPVQNRAIGRAYLALLFAHYGNWLDAIAAYNWGPGNMDAWIGAGRPAGLLSAAVVTYVWRVLGGGRTQRTAAPVVRPVAAVLPVRTVAAAALPRHPPEHPAARLSREQRLRIETGLDEDLRLKKNRVASSGAAVGRQVAAPVARPTFRQWEEGLTEIASRLPFAR